MLSDGHVTVVAEAGVNHNGSLDRALEMVEVAARAGANAVKFQSFRAELLATADAPKARYQYATTGPGETQREMLRVLELDGAAHLTLANRCRERGIVFLSTPFDLESLALLVAEVGVPAIKISSGDLTNGPLLHAAAHTGKPVLLSTGMATQEEIQVALDVLAHGYTEREESPNPRSIAGSAATPAGRRAVRENVTLLQCTTDYPADPADLNLRAMATLRERFGTRVGFSDHSTGIAAALAAVALGAAVIEKHFTLDRSLPGPDHQASLEPRELAAMIQGIRVVEAALGDPEKRPVPAEIRNAAAARRSLVAIRPIKRGEAFSVKNLGTMRPGTGISPMRYWDWIGRRADRAYQAGELIEE